ncbi:MAG: hypothetical protein WCX74_04050 [Candidatus Paceibacterota bacterium]
MSDFLILLALVFLIPLGMVVEVFRDSYLFVKRIYLFLRNIFSYILLIFNKKGRRKKKPPPKTQYIIIFSNS